MGLILRECWWDCERCGKTYCTPDCSIRMLVTDCAYGQCSTGPDTPPDDADDEDGSCDPSQTPIV